MNRSLKSTRDGHGALFQPELYVYFNDSFLSEEQTTVEVAFLEQQLDLRLDIDLLDLACGFGRHVNAIAGKVRSAIGIDINAAFIAKATDAARLAGHLNVRFERSDILQIEYAAQFDRVLLLNTIFGLFDDSGNFALLRRINSALRIGGTVCVDFINRDTLLEHFMPHGIVAKDGNFMLDQLSFDPLSGRVHNHRVYLKDGLKIDAPFSLRVYSLTEIAALLTTSGFRLDRVFADWRASEFDARSKKIVVVATKQRDLAAS